VHYRPLGHSGLLVSAVGLGTNNVGWRLDADATRSIVDAAQDAGITLIDTADIYGEGVRLRHSSAKRSKAAVG
jgi:aryl-alcohol dehydrogenase-like predicted oxidoreductase